MLFCLTQKCFINNWLINQQQFNNNFFSSDKVLSLHSGQMTETLKYLDSDELN